MSGQSGDFSNNEGSIDFKNLVKVLKRRFLIFLILPMLAVAASGLASYYVLPPVYEAKTILMVNQTSDSQKTAMNSFVGQVKSDVLMQRVVSTLRLNESIYTPRYLSRQIKVSAAKDSNLIEIAVSNGDPDLAAEIANTLGSELMLLIAEKNREMVDHSVNILKSQMAAIQKELASTTGQVEKKLLEDTLALLGDKTRITRSIELGSTSIVVMSPALRPAAPIKPNKELNMVLAFIIGLMVSVALAFARESLDNTIKTPEDVARHLNLPVLGIILYPDRHTRK